MLILLLLAWLYDIHQGRWINIEPSGIRPSARHSACSATDFLDGNNGTSFFVFGGRDSSGDKNDFWVFNTTSNMWSNVETTNPPDPRFLYTYLYVVVFRVGGKCWCRDGFFYLYGGQTENFRVTPPSESADQLNQIIMVLNLSDNVWSSVSISYTDESKVKGSTPVVSKFSLSTTADRGTTFIYSGIQLNSAETLEAQYTSVSTLMTKIEINQNNPTTALVTHFNLTEDIFQLESTTSVYMNNILYVMFGRNTTLENYFNPYILVITGLMNNDVNISLARLNATSVPTPRRNHQAVVSMGKMWVFGAKYFNLFINFSYFLVFRRVWRSYFDNILNIDWLLINQLSEQSIFI
jgi:hypothetical protein